MTDNRHKKRTRGAMAVLLSGVSLVLYGCSNPYAFNIGDINFTAEQKKGVIQFSDPKLYKREALINERRSELEYLKAALSSSATVSLEPEIVRELETIQSLSAGLGLKIDPLSAINVARSSELAEIKSDIEITRLGMELAQLKRDAELMKTKLQTQTEPSGTNSTTSGAAVTGGVEAPGISDLLIKVSDLQKTLSDRAGTPFAALKKGGGAANPIDVFNDRAALRSRIKAEINATSLDELHDLDGNSLFRLQTRATVLPDLGHADTLGMLRMEVVPPEFNDDPESEARLRRLYWEWLGHVNRSLNLPLDQAENTKINSSLMPLMDLFDIIFLELPKLGDQTAVCNGLYDKQRTDACLYKALAVPRTGSSERGNPNSFIALLDPSLTHPRTLVDSMESILNTAKTNKNRVIMKSDCINFENDIDDALTSSMHDTLKVAQLFESNWLYISYLTETLTLNRKTAEIFLNSEKFLNNIRKKNQYYSDIIQIIKKANPNCAQKISAMAVVVPQKFKNNVKALVRKARVSVYDVAPIERVQQVSTAARAADAVSLAASIAGQIPNYGIGMSGSIGYSRSAVGKVDALERAPIVVGFAEPAYRPENALPERPKFGWMLGPKASIDAEKQSVVLRHDLKPYDLYAELSLPGWWPYFDLKTQTAWAPDWKSGEGSSLDANIAKSLARKVRVPMSHNQADMEGLTKGLFAEAEAVPMIRPQITQIAPNDLSACSGTVTFQISGENLWRASAVNIGGLLIEESRIRVLPDMRGILVTVDVSALPPIQGKQAFVSVWTQDGSDQKILKFVDVKKGAECKGTEPEKKETGEPEIASIIPATLSGCDASPKLIIQGKNLAAINNVLIGTALGKVDKAEKDGKRIEVSASIKDVKTKIAGLNKLSITLRSPVGLVSKEIAVVDAACKEAAQKSTNTTTIQAGVN